MRSLAVYILHALRLDTRAQYPLWRTPSAALFVRQVASLWNHVGCKLGLRS